jgi:hypothetical protein
MLLPFPSSYLLHFASTSCKTEKWRAVSILKCQLTSAAPSARKMMQRLL